MIDREQILEAFPLTTHLQNIGVRLRGEGVERTANRCPQTQHKAGHWCVTINPLKQIFFCNDCKVGGSIVDWLAAEQNRAATEVLKELAGKIGATEETKHQGQSKAQIVATYDYADADGELLYQVVRMEPKSFRQRQPDANGGWRWSMEGANRVLFNLPRVLVSPMVIVVEGEKDCLNLEKLGFVATCNVGGAGKWLDAYSDSLKGRDVVIIPDGDKPGQDHAKKVADSLYGKANSIKTVSLPDPHKDASDFIASFKGQEEAVKALTTLIERTPHTVGPDAGPERRIVGTMLAAYTEPLPANTKKLILHAPRSFLDPALGAVAEAIRETALASEPVAELTVRRRLETRGTLAAAGGAVALSKLADHAVSIDLAEFEASDCWQRFQATRTQAVFCEAAETLREHPNRAGIVAEVVTRTLADLNRDSETRTLTIRRPSEILGFKFDESDNLLGDRLLSAGGYLTICGAGETGKSRMLLQLAVATIAGLPFLGFETRGTGKRWLILQAENSNRRLQHDLENLRRWCGEKAWQAVENGLVIHTLETDEDSFLSLEEPETIRLLESVIEETRPDIIGFDSLYNFSSGDLNSDVDMRRTLTALSRVTRKGNPNRAAVVLHHAQTGKAGAARATGYDRSSFGRNSKVLHAWTRGQINLAPAGSENNEVLVAACGKSSNGKPFEPFAVRLNQDPLAFVLESNFDLQGWEADVNGRKATGPLVSFETIAEVCRGEMTKPALVKAIQEETGCGKSLAYKRLEAALNAKKIRRAMNGKTYFAP